MRTLKKTLCLVLCLAMMAGLCVIGTSAAFSDAEEIKNKEAVDLLTGLGILVGYPEGDFKPGEVLTREQACKIIVYLLEGKEYADALPKAYPFEDVQGSWASGYISYCKKAGIVVGVNDEQTLFDPEGELTAAAWAKMLLCALGYSDKAEGLIGEAWDLNVTHLVSRTKLAEGMAFLYTDAMTRDNAALLAFNALTVPMVEYANGSSFSIGGATFESEGQRDTTGEFLCQKYGLKAVDTDSSDKKEAKYAFQTAYVDTGIVTANSANAVDATATVVGATSYKYESGIELLGHYVRVYKDSKGNVLSLTEIGSVKTVETALDKADDVKAAFGKKGSDVVKGLTSIVKFDAGAVDTAAGAYNITDDAAPAGLYVFDDAGKLVAELLNSYKIVEFAKVTDVITTADKEAIQLSIPDPTDPTKDLKLENNAKKDEVEENGAAKGDYVLVEKYGEKYTLIKAETVEGTISKVDGTNVTLDGTVYKLSAVANTSDLATALPAAAADLKNTYVLYLDGEGQYVVCKVKTVVSDTTFDPYYLVSSKATPKDTYPNADKGDYGKVTKYYVSVIDLKGEVSQIEVAGDADTALANSFVKLKAVDKQDYKVCEDATPAVPTGKLIVKGSAQIKADESKYTIGGKEIRVNAETAIYFVSTKDGKTVVDKKTGPVAMEAAKSMIVLAEQDNDSNNVAKYIFVEGEFKPGTVASPDAIIYVKAGTVNSGFTADGYVFQVYDAVKGEAKTITMADADALTGKAGFYKFTENDKGIVALGDAVSFVTGAYAGKYENSIKVGSGEYPAADAIFVDLRAKEDTKTKVTSIDTLVTEAKEKTLTLDILLNSKNAATIIFVK